MAPTAATTAAAAADKVRCPICLVKKQMVDMQTLNCKHVFCGQCLSMYTGQFCPQVECTGTVSTDIYVDEMSRDEERQKITFGSMLSMLALEERQKCDGRRGVLPCANMARMSLLNCRHNSCYDCLSERVQLAAATTEGMPICPVEYCANVMSRADVIRLSEKSPAYATMCSAVEKRLKKPAEVMPASREEIAVDCSIYGKEASKRRLIIPKGCQISDLISAMMQIQRLTLERSTSSLGIFVRQEVQKGTVKYEVIRPKQLGKKTIKDMGWADKMELVIDLENVLAARK